MIKTQIRKYFLVNALLTLGRVLPQAVLTPILVGKGLSFSEIVVVQIVFTVSTLLLEFPSGVFSDRFSRKLTYLISIALLGVAYTVVFVGQGLFLMSLAWLIYGASSAAQSATMDYEFVLKVRSSQKELKKFYANDRNIILASSILAALFSAPLYETFGDSLYLISVGLIVLSGVLGLFLLPKPISEPSPKHESSVGPVSEIRDQIFLALKDRRIVLAIMLIGVAEIAINPFFHLWQMVLLGENFEVWFFGIFFIISQILNILANFMFARLPVGFKTELALILVIGLLGAAFLLMPGGASALTLLLLLPLPLFLYLASIETTLQLIIPEKVLSSVGSLGGFFSSVVSLFSLGSIAMLLNKASPSAVLGLSLIAFSALSIVIIFIVLRLKKTAKEVIPVP